MWCGVEIRWSKEDRITDTNVHRVGSDYRSDGASECGHSVEHEAASEAAPAGWSLLYGARYGGRMAIHMTETVTCAVCGTD
jgi:hypothetical protein